MFLDLIVLCRFVSIIQISKLLYFSHFIREFLVLLCVQEINKMGKINAMFTWNCSPWKTLQSLFLRIQMWVQYCPLVLSFSFYSSYLDASRPPTSIKCMYIRTIHVIYIQLRQQNAEWTANLYTKLVAWPSMCISYNTNRHFNQVS